MTRALVFGAAGQDGSYLCEALVADGVETVGTVRPGRLDAVERLASVKGRVKLVEADLRDAAAIERAVAVSAPDQVYLLAAESFMPATWADPVGTADASALGAARALEAVRRLAPKARVVHASSSELFGRPRAEPQDESTPIAPRTPYGAAKAFVRHLIAAYRERHGLFASDAILFNHESPRRRPEFVTRKITRAAARIKLGLEKELKIGDLDARRDWGYAGDTVAALRRIAAHERPDDFVVATGTTRTVQDFVAAAFGAAGLDWKKFVVSDPALKRGDDGGPAVRGDASKARRELGWEPKVPFERLVAEMVRWDLECAKSGAPELAAPPFPL